MTGERYQATGISIPADLAMHGDRLRELRRELAEVATLTAEEIVARHDPSLSVARLKALLSEPDSSSRTHALPDAGPAARFHAETASWDEFAFGGGEWVGGVLPGPSAVDWPSPEVHDEPPSRAVPTSEPPGSRSEQLLYYSVGNYRNADRISCVYRTGDKITLSEFNVRYFVPESGKQYPSSINFNEFPYSERQVFHGPRIAEISGVIRQFNISKGYGYIVPDENFPEIYMHARCLTEAGYALASEGSRVHCLVLCFPKKWQVFQVLGVDQSTAVHPAQRPRPPGGPLAQGTWERAIVRLFNRSSGFGILSLKECESDIRVSRRILEQCGFAELQPGQEVDVRWGTGTRGRIAVDLRPVGTLDNGPSSH